MELPNTPPNEPGPNDPSPRDPHHEPLPGSQPPHGQPGQPEQPGQPTIEQIHHSPLGARVPDSVATGVFATGAVVLNGPGEFIIDFLQGVARPVRVIKRVVMPPIAVGQFVEAFADNLRHFDQSYGPPKPLPPLPAGAVKPALQDFYDELKLADQDLCGVYANAVMITHTPAEFLFDFITRFFPRAAVSARIYVAASHAPGMLETISSSYQHYRRLSEPPQPPPPVTPPDLIV